MGSHTKLPPAAGVSNQTVRSRLYEGSTSSTGICAHSLALYSSIGIRQRTPEFSGLPLMPQSLHRCEQVHTEHMCTCDRGESVWKHRGERYAAYIYMVANGTLTAVR